MSEMQFDFDGLIQLLAGHLYSEKKVFIREMIQNSHDAIQRRAAADPDFSIENGRIDISTDLNANPAIIRFSDNGLGMSDQSLRDYLSSVGSSGTRTNQEDAPDVIGQFGIGFLSGFVVAGRIIVRTKPWEQPNKTGWRWENEGRKDYVLESEEVEKVGTEVTIYLNSAEDMGLIRDDAIREVIRTYADMLKIPIYLNYSDTPINQRIMPWERKDISDAERDIDCRVYLEKTMPDSVLEVIPLNESGEVNVSGVLYITRTRVVGRDAPRVLRVFQKRMFLCENTPEILPRWAGFVNGVLNTPDLSPNAARDNFRRDPAYEKLRERLGELIIEHFEKLKESNRERLSEILAFHDLAIKAACHYYDAFFEKFGHLLEWKVNSQSPAVLANPSTGYGRFSFLNESSDYTWITLPELVNALPQPEGDGLKRLNCFTSHSSANQFFEMANASKTSVLDASAGFETELIKTWANNHPEIRLVYVDREDDPNVFRDIDLNTDKKVQALANHMSLIIRPGGTGRMRVEARRFEPQELPAVLKSTPESSGKAKALEILNDPNSSASLRSMAEEMMRLSHNADMRMTINATNPLIRQLAALENFDDEEVNDLMIGVYNDAILYNQELMTPSNAKVFHQQFGRLLQRSVEYLEQREQLRIFEQNQQQQTVSNSSDRRHKVAFYMTPFNPTFEKVRCAVRQVVEEELGCQLLTAADITYDDLIKGNVRKHIDSADFYIADVTGANPNVMQELGAVHYGRRSCPTLLIAAQTSEQNNPDLPADLQGHITSSYSQSDEINKVVADLLRDFNINQGLKYLLEEPERERFLSPDTLKSFTNSVFNDPSHYQILSDKLPTVSDWKNTTETELKNLLRGDEADLAGAALNRVLKQIEAYT